MSQINKLKIDLTLLKQLVAELEISLDACAPLLEDKEQKNKFTVEMFKACGVAAGISQEAVALVSDITAVMRTSQYPDFANDLAKSLGLSKNPIKGGMN